MAPFYSSLCTELGRPLDSDLLKKLEEENVKKLEKLEEGIKDAEKNFGETEQRDALLAKAEYLCKIGDKVSGENITSFSFRPFQLDLFIVLSCQFFLYKKKKKWHGLIPFNEKKGRNSRRCKQLYV